MGDGVAGMEDWIPPRPWDVRKRGDTLIVGSVEKTGEIGEVVCTFEYGEETHKPIELTRARLLALLVNACPAERWEEIAGC
jgi:hypothetical protein